MEIDYSQTNPVWFDAAHTQIELTLYGERVVISAVPGLTHYDELVAAEVPIGDYVPPDPPPLQADEVLFDHENRLRALEGQEPLAQPEDMAKR